MHTTLLFLIIFRLLPKKKKKEKSIYHRKFGEKVNNMCTPLLDPSKWCDPICPRGKLFGATTNGGSKKIFQGVHYKT